MPRDLHDGYDPDLWEGAILALRGMMGAPQPLPARVSALLLDCGLIHEHAHGWGITKAGYRFAGGQDESQTISGVSNHARVRAVQRLGRDLTRDEWHHVVLSITGRGALLLSAQRDASIYLVCLPGTDFPFRVVWSLVSGVVTTVLPGLRLKERR